MLLKDPIMTNPANNMKAYFTGIRVSLEGATQILMSHYMDMHPTQYTGTKSFLPY